MPKRPWTVAQARARFFGVLHLAVLFTGGVSRVPDSLPHVVLSQDTWIRNFGRKPSIAGAKLHIGSVDARVVGDTSGDSMGFPGTVKAWLLDPDPQIVISNLEFDVGLLMRTGYLEDARCGRSV